MMLGHASVRVNYWTLTHSRHCVERYETKVEHEKITLCTAVCCNDYKHNYAFTKVMY